MAKVWDDFIPLLSPYLPGCPDLSLKSYLALTAADFFARTYLWRDDIDAIYIAPNQIEYDLGADAVVEDVISVVYKNKQLERSDIRFVPAEWRDKSGDPTTYWIQADRSIRVFPTPEERGKLSVTAVLKPSSTGSGVDDWIFETWSTTINSGVIAQLAMINGKEWTNTDLAMLHKGMYERAITSARIRDFRGVDLSVKMRPAVRR